MAKCCQLFNRIRVKKYHVIDSTYQFWTNVVLCQLALLGMGAQAWFFEFFFMSENYLGMPIVTLQSPNDTYFEKSGAKIGADIQDYVHQVPTTNKFIIAKRTKTEYQTLRYCASSNCSSGCLPYWKKTLTPSWCKQDNFVQDVSFYNVENTNVMIQIMFQKNAPKALHDAGNKKQIFTLSQLQSSLPNQNHQGNIQKLGQFYNIKCKLGSCKLESIVEKLSDEETTDMTDYKYVDTNNRFHIEIYGYYSIVECKATYLRLIWVTLPIQFGSWILLCEMIGSFTAWLYFTCSKRGPSELAQKVTKMGYTSSDKKD